MRTALATCRLPCRELSLAAIACNDYVSTLSATSRDRHGPGGCELSLRELGWNQGSAHRIYLMILRHIGSGARDAPERFLKPARYLVNRFASDSRRLSR